MILETKNMRAIPLLLVGLLAFVPAAESAEVRADWSKVRETQPVRRPVRQRRPAYVAAAAMPALNHAVIVPRVGGTEQEPIVFGVLNLLTTAPVLLVGHFGLGRKIICEAPAKHRND